MKFVASLTGTGGQHGIYQYDSGVWTRTQDVPAGVAVFNLHRNPVGHIMATTDGAIGYYVSTDEGATWTPGGIAQPAASFGWSQGWDENDVIYDSELSRSAQQIKKSTDDGITFTNAAAKVNVSDLPIFTDSQSTWASRGNLFWNERYIQGGIGHAALIKNGVSTSLTTTGQVLVRGLFDDDMVVAFGNFFNRLWKYDSTNTLTDLTSTLPTMTGDIYCVIPFTTTLWFLAETQSGTTYCRLWRTTDAGLTWSVILNDITAIPSPGVANGGEIFISRNPFNHNEFLVVGKGGVWHTLNNGTTWDFITAPSSVMEFMSIAWIGAESVSYAGIARFAQADGTQTWFLKAS